MREARAIPSRLAPMLVGALALINLAQRDAAHTCNDLFYQEEERRWRDLFETDALSKREMAQGNNDYSWGW